MLGARKGHCLLVVIVSLGLACAAVFTTAASFRPAITTGGASARGIASVSASGTLDPPWNTGISDPPWN